MGYVFVVDGQAKDWSISKKMFTSPELAAGWARKLISELRPNLLLTEALDDRCRKGEAAKGVIDAIARACVESGEHHSAISAPPEKKCANKYEEAAALADRFPEIAPWLPTGRRAWEGEPAKTVYIEALRRVVAVMDDERA
ncbi:MAG: hypothetical protein H6883_02615 [Rhodobiaceae bacterium]|nr:hypothetical protein [Rhodobiaceae bacterium]MCC0055011.1 hypothetical protein [Rhodobiaceae bacterium]